MTFKKLHFVYRIAPWHSIYDSRLVLLIQTKGAIYYQLCGANPFKSKLWIDFDQFNTYMQYLERLTSPSSRWDWWPHTWWPGCATSCPRARASAPCPPRPAGLPPSCRRCTMRRWLGPDWPWPNIRIWLGPPPGATHPCLRSGLRGGRNALPI